MFVLGLVTWLLCRSLENVSQHNSDFELDDQEEDKKSEKLELEDELLFEDFELGDEDCELPEEEEVDVEDGELEEADVEESTKMKILRQIADVASKLKEIVGNLITTAGKVVVTILLGLTATQHCFCAPEHLHCNMLLMDFIMNECYLSHLLLSLFGISPVVQTDCSHTWMFRVNPDLEWHHFVNPIMLLVLYYTLATLIRLWLQESEDMVRLQEKEGETEEREEPESPESNMADYTAEKKRQLWRMAHYRTDERHLLTTQEGYSTPEVLMVTSNGASLDFTSVLHENGPKPVELYSSPHYRPGRPESDLQKVDCGVYKIDSVYVELPEVPRPFGVVRVNAAVKAFRFIMKQSYICALIAMMAWSITYVSWLTFIFLIWSCILWMVRDRRKYSMITSPFMVFYGNLLIILQYIWSFESLQPPVPGLFLKKEVPFRELGSKTLCLLSFWLLLRQFLTERREKPAVEAQLSDVRAEGHTTEGLEDEAGGHREMMDVLGRTVMAMLNKYWIYICGGMFFLVSFEGRIVMYKIIYMMMFLFCVALYQLHYERWRWMLKYFWMSVVVYTMLVLILVYTFQFESSINVWSNMTGMSREKLEDLGLEKFSVPALFTRIFIPTSFLLVCILHLHYFHERFLELTDIKSVADKQKSTISRYKNVKSQRDVKILIIVMHVLLSCEELKNKWRLVVERLTVLFLKFLDCVQKLQLFIWWLLELHIIKIVSSYIIWVSVREVSLFNYVFLVSWAFALPFSQFRPLASSVCTVWTCVIVVCKMLYQLTSINPSSYSRSCSMPENYTDAQRSDMARSLLYSGPVDPANWIGFRKFSPLLENLRNNLLMLALLAFEVTIYRHQDFYRMKNNLTPPVTRTVFHNITRQHLDHGIVNCAKYFIDYFFYKFGLETCFLLAVNVIGQRMDFYAMLHAFGLIVVMYQSRRKAIARVWSKYCFFLACMLAFQYLMCIGIPPAACTAYSILLSFSTSSSLHLLIYLQIPVKPNNLLMQGFENVCKQLKKQNCSDFTRHCLCPLRRSYLDMLKVMMFSYLFWFVLTIIFITGTTRISIFCMGYLLACFYFLIFGGELLLKPIKSILHYWDFLIAYNVFVITMKNILSIVACGYIKALVANHCWLIQLFSLACTIKGYSKPEQNANKQCELPSDEAGIIWDSICFAFLLLQRRVFMSYYFLHVVADIRSSQVLASRGAELFQATIVKAVKARIEEEKKSMDLLKRQMDRIKSRQQKFKRGKERMLSLAQESGERHSGVTEEEEEDEGIFTREHFGLIRARAPMVGNYYLFETDSEEEEEDEDKKDEEPPKRSAFQFVYHAWITDSKTAMKERSKERRRFWQRYTERSTNKKNQKQVHVAIEEGDQEEGVTEQEVSDGPDNTLKRVFNIVKFSWVLFLTLLDGFTAWLNSICQEHIDISTVLRIERCMLTHEVKKGNIPSRDSIHTYYQRQMCRPASAEDKYFSPLRSQAYESDLSGENLSSVYTESTVLYESTLDQPEETSDSVLKTSQRSRPRLCRLPSVDLQSSRYEPLVHSEHLEVTQLSSQQEADLPEHPDKLWSSTSDLPPPSYSKATGLDSAGRTEGSRLRIQTPDDEKSADTQLTASELLQSRTFYDEELEASEHFYRSQPQLLQLCYALYSMLVAHSQMLCYLVIILNHMISASVATLVLPILIFLWAMLSVPRPSKRFWMTAIVYTEHCITCSPLEGMGAVRMRVQTADKNITVIHSTPVHQFTSGEDTSCNTSIKKHVSIIHNNSSSSEKVHLLFCLNAKHSAAADITSSLSEDQVPEAFLVMVLIQFGTMVVDRALYLRKTVMGKVIFQVILVFGIHFWMFFILPGVTERRFSQNTVAQLWYFVKCIYFGLSAYQIRCGYPTRVLGNFLTKSYNYLNLFLFQGFRLVPFLTELRAVMDWVWTDTTLSLSSWICVEDIYAHIFVLKCWRESEKRYPQPRGQKKKKVVKYGMGGMIVMLLICIVWFPLLFMSLVKSVAGVVNKPLDVSVTITLGGFQPIFTMSAQQNQLKDVTDRDFISFMNSYKHNSSALQFLEAYTAEDVTVAELEGSSNSLWTISPPSRKNLMEVLSKEDQFPVTMSWSIQRNLSLGAKAEFAVDKHITYLDMNTRQELIALLNGTRNKPVVIEQVFPCFIRAPSDSNAKPVGQLYSDEGYKSIQLDLERSHNGTEDIQEWWIVDQPSAGKIQMRSESKLEKKREAGLQLYVFSDKVSPPSLGFLAGYGIMGLYASVVLVIGKFVREFFSGISHSIMFEELPCVDRILKLCTDIFLVRETGELELEEDLYAKLIFLYRSPETMIKWTREKTK
uniref:Piezo-type mechanosensitive ion channel component 2-like n=1 Tax=Sinocyclocheilus grahami TaxID=75366 RepID=A0A672M614_SINGR